MLMKELQAKLAEFKVVRISEENVRDVWALMKGNVYFYSRTQGHEVTLEECRDDITALPPGARMDEKTYVAVYDGDDDQMLAAVDLIEGFPDEKTAYIGLLMLDAQRQRKGLGKRIFEAIMMTAKEKGFEYIELACYEANEIGFTFWCANGFEVIRKSERKTDGKCYTLFSMRRTI